MGLLSGGMDMRLAVGLILLAFCGGCGETDSGVDSSEVERLSREVSALKDQVDLLKTKAEMSGGLSPTVAMLVTSSETTYRQLMLQESEIADVRAEALDAKKEVASLRLQLLAR